MPEKLITKLITFLLDQKNFNNHLGCRETKSGDEFTIFVVGSLESMKNLNMNTRTELPTLAEPTLHEDDFIFKNDTQGQDYQDCELYADEIVETHEKIMLKKDVQKYGVNSMMDLPVLDETFYDDDSFELPKSSPVKKKRPTKKRKKTSELNGNNDNNKTDIETAAETDYERTGYESETNFGPDNKKRKITVIPKNGITGVYCRDPKEIYVCKLCDDTAYSSKHDLRRHYMASHTDYFNQNENALGKEILSISSRREEIIKNNKAYMRSKNLVSKPKYKEKYIEMQNLKEIDIDPITGDVTCKICTKVIRRPLRKKYVPPNLVFGHLRMSSLSAFSGPLFPVCLPIACPLVLDLLPRLSEVILTSTFHQ